MRVTVFWMLRRSGSQKFIDISEVFTAYIIRVVDVKYL
jgi:hypothetical protein